MGARGSDPRRSTTFAIVAVLAASLLGFALGRTLPRSRAEAASLLEGGAPDLSAVDSVLVAAAREARVDPDLLRGLAAAESSGNPTVRSRAGAVGLLQLVPETAAEQARALGLDPARIDLTDAATNARLGARYLRRLLDQLDGQLPFALAAYNAGATHVRQWRMRALDVGAAEVVRREGFSETRHHVARTLRYRDLYRAMPLPR